jgi:hypothetical protein
MPMGVDNKCAMRIYFTKNFKDRVTLEIYGIKLGHWATPGNMGASQKLLSLVIK